MNHPAKRWMAFLACIFAVYLFVFYLLPIGEHVSGFKEVLKSNQKSGLNISAIFYTEVDEIADITQAITVKRAQEAARR